MNGLGRFDYSYFVFVFYYFRLNFFKRRNFGEQNNLWIFCKWAKNWKISFLYLSSFYLLEPFASKESMSIIILIFFHVDLNFLHVKVVPLKIILINVCVYVLCRMDQPFGYSIIPLFFLSTAIQLHVPNNPK